MKLFIFLQSFKRQENRRVIRRSRYSERNGKYGTADYAVAATILAYTILLLGSGHLSVHEYPQSFYKLVLMRDGRHTIIPEELIHSQSWVHYIFTVICRIRLKKETEFREDIYLPQGFVDGLHEEMEFKLVLIRTCIMETRVEELHCPSLQQKRANSQCENAVLW